MSTHDEVRVNARLQMIVHNDLRTFEEGADNE